MQYTTFKGAIALIVTALLTACGGGGGGGGGDDAPPPPAIISGTFVDSPVEGLRWESNALTGTTDVAGSYQYRDGDPVKFYLGDIYLGESTGFTVILPVDIVPGAENINNETVLNIARTLLTLDDDANPDNGIKITPVVSDQTLGETLNFAVSTDQFTVDAQPLINKLTSATEAGARDLVTADYAREHLRNTIRGLLAGDYIGTYTGDGAGNWAGTVTMDGVFTGTATPNNISSPPVQLTGSFTDFGSGKSGFKASGKSEGEGVITFVGTYKTDGRAGGSWSDQSQAATGTWSGNKLL